MVSLAYITADFKPTSNAASVRASNFIDGLKEKYNVTVFTAIPNSDYVTISNISKLPSNKDKNIVRLFKEIIFGIEYFLRILFSKKRDVYILTSPQFFIAIFAFFAVKIKNPKKIILDIRDIYPEVFFQHGIMKRDSIIGKVLIKVERYMYKNSNHIITVTEGLKKQIEPFNKNVKVVRNGYDEKLFTMNAEKYDNFTLVFHGTMGKFQNIELLSEVIKYCDCNHSDFRFLVVGNGSKDYLIKNLQCKNLQYFQNVEYSKIPDLISKAHLGLSFRTDDRISAESFPVKIFEYIGVGIPVIVTPISEAGNVVDKYKMGIESDNSLINIINNIIKIKEDHISYTRNIKNQRILFTRNSSSNTLFDLIGESN